MLYIVTVPYSFYTDLSPNITHLTLNFVLFQYPVQPKFIKVKSQMCRQDPALFLIITYKIC